MTKATRTIDRAIDVVRAETTGLRDGGDFDVHASSLRKHRLLLELHHLRPQDAAAERIRELATALDENAIELDARLVVARRVAEIAIDVVRRDGCDGTYGAGDTSR